MRAGRPQTKPATNRLSPRLSGSLSYHLQVRHILPEALIPVLYAIAMGVDALAALASGEIYDRIGLRGLVVLPLGSRRAPITGC